MMVLTGGSVAEPKPRQTPYVINDIKSEIDIYNLLLKILNKQTPRMVASKKIQTDILSVKRTSETELPLQEQEERTIERVKKYFEEFNAVLIWFGYLPTICEPGTTQDLYLAHFYK